jgi:hypothetical protein
MMSSAEHPPAPLRVAVTPEYDRPVPGALENAERGSKTPCVEGWLSR